MSSWRERLQETRETIERRTGYSVTRQEKLAFLEESDAERRMLQKDLDLLAYTALNYVGGAPQELKAVERRRLTQRSRVVWMKDPQAGAAVDLMNDFVFGRGIQKPKANDPAVQQVIDEAWDDPDNQLVLTSYFAQLELGTDFELQSNLFFLIFEDGQDGKVKLGMLEHDSVENVVRDEDNRLRVLYYLARHWDIRWDYENDQPMMVTTQAQRQAGVSSNMPGANLPVRDSTPGVNLPGQGEVRYYEHWRNVEDALEDAEKGAREFPQECPEQKLGDGKVFHVAMNKGKEMAFGHPRMDRVIRWYNAYNNFMDARVDIMAASAAFVMKRKVKGTPQQLQKMANQALSRRSALAMGRDPMVGAEMGPKAASIITENESVSHEDFNISTNSPQAAQDAQMLRSQISAATRFPQSYYGDASQSNLATATSLELPVLKAVETRQTMVEHIVRFFIDRVIERAVDAGRLSADLSDDEVASKQKAKPDRAPGPDNLEPSDEMQQAYEDEGQDEQDTERDLGYEFQMPSPLQRLLGDLVLAVMNIAKTFDPNNTNTELSRALLAVSLQELGLEDPAGAVERILPAGYVDPAVAAAMNSQQNGMGAPSTPAPGMPGSQAGEFSPDAMTGGPGGDPNNGYGGGYAGGNPYGAVSGSRSPEQVAEAWQRGRETRLRLGEMRSTDESAEFQRRVAERIAAVDALFDEAVDGALGSVTSDVA